MQHDFETQSPPVVAFLFWAAVAAGSGLPVVLLPVPKPFGFPKAERLKSRKRIDGLFASGKSVSVFPVRAVYRFEAAEAGGMQVGVSVSKRFFKKAADRNRIKRLLREAYRLQKADLLAQVKESGQAGCVFFLYTAKEKSDFETVKAAVAKCLQRLAKLAQRENPS